MPSSALPCPETEAVEHDLASRIRRILERRSTDEEGMRIVSITPSCETWVAIHRGTLALILERLERAP